MKILRKAAVTALCLTMVTPVTAMADGYGAEYGTPVIDAEKDDAWSRAAEYTTEVFQGDDKGAYADFRLLWDEKYVYVYAEVHDGLLSAASADAYQQDSVEIFIDENDAKTEYYEKDDAQYRVSFENMRTYGEGADEKNFVTETKKTDYGYIVEAAVPFGSMTPETDAVIGFEVQVNDDGDGGGKRTSIAKLKDPTDLSYCSTENYADVTLKMSDSADFSDTREEAEYSDAVSKLFKKGVVLGYGDGTFGPDKGVSREEFVCMAARMFGIYGDDAECDFEDTDKTAWYYQAVALMTQKGYINGVSPDAFGVGEKVKSADMAEILKRILKDNEIGNWEYAAKDGYATRGECAVAVYDAYRRLCRPKEKVKAPYGKELIGAADMKAEGDANPLMTQRFGADPFAMEYGGRVYIYMTGDTYRYDDNGELLDNDYSNINTISVISSADLVNWTDHGEIAAGGRGNDAGAAKWAKNSWAPCAAHKTVDGKEKFFLYFADNGSGIGVLEADSPTGPFRDPIGKPLIDGSTPGCSGVVWLFDPAVLIDDDGGAYLYFGGGLPTADGVIESDHPKTTRVIRLGDDMTSVEGEAKEIDAPAVFEDSGIHKYNGRYYYSYCSNFEGEHEGGKYPFGAILYMTSDSPTGPFEYRGLVLDNMYKFFNVGGNNHHAIFSFNGKWYITYHAQTVEKYLGDIRGYRSTHINELEYSSDGMIKPVGADFKGVEPVRRFNPFEETSAATIARMSGVSTKSADGATEVCDINDGDWICVRNADFEGGAKSVSIAAPVIDGGDIEIRLDAPDGALAGTVRAGNAEPAALTEEISGVHDIYFVFKCGGDGEPFTMRSWQFIK